MLVLRSPEAIFDRTMLMVAVGLGWRCRRGLYIFFKKTTPIKKMVEIILFKAYNFF